MRWLLAWLALLAALMGAPVAAQDYPTRPDGPVYDGANVISPGEEELLDQRLRDYNRTSGRAIIVATVPSLDGEEVQIYARDLAERWDIGGAESENGLLLLVAPNDRQMWISTARGLQERMTDIMAGRIYRDVMVPRFKAKDFAGASEALGKSFALSMVCGCMPTYVPPCALNMGPLEDFPPRRPLPG